MKSYKMKSWYQIQISYMTSHHDILVYDIISLKSYAWDMISRNHHVTYDIIVSSMKSYPWHHSQAYHTYNIWNHTIWNHDIISRFHIWYYIVIYWYMTSYDWNHMHGPGSMGYDITKPKHMISGYLWYHSFKYEIIPMISDIIVQPMIS